MKEVINLLAEDHEAITDKIDQLHSLLNGEPQNTFPKIVEILSFFDQFTFKHHHQREEKVLYNWMIGQNEKADTSLIQKIMDDHKTFENSSKEMKLSIEKYLNNIPGPTPVSILYDLSLFITKYREHIEREESFIFAIADGLKISKSEKELLLKKMI